MTEPLLLALDQGTSSSRAVLFNPQGEPLASAQVPLAIEYPADGWVEQQPQAIWQSQLQAMQALAAQLSEEQRRAVAACGVTNQRETTLLWRRSDGTPLAPALVWQDRRSSAICADWQQRGDAGAWQHQTGLVLDPYFSASKIRWLLGHHPAAAAAQQQGDLCFGTVDSWLLWQLSGGRLHATDHSNASRTLLLDLEQRRWWPPALASVGLSGDALPQLLPSRGSFSSIAAGLPFAGVPITAVLGDQQAATYGQLCLAPGQAKCTYGTGAFLVVTCGDRPVRPEGGLLGTVGWTDAEGRATYCIEGSLFNAGTVVQWLRDGLGLIENSAEIDALAASVPSAGELMLVPAFTGWGTPHWDPSARGLLIGLTRDTSAAHLARAALNGIALAVSTLVDTAAAALGEPLQELAVDGGACASNALMQAQADSTALTVRRPAHLESTARGVALMAGQEAGVVTDLEPIRQGLAAGSSRFAPQLSAAARELWRRRWQEAVRRCLHWHGDANV
jgi:glycerol kinase